MVTSFQTLLQPGTLLLIFLTSRFTWRAMLNKVDMVDMDMVDMDMVDMDMMDMDILDVDMVDVDMV